MVPKDNKKNVGKLRVAEARNYITAAEDGVGR